jgi:transposase
MKQPLFIRPLSESEQMVLEQGLRSRDAFTLRRCQILLASAKGKRPRRIAEALGCTAQTVRNTIRAFEQEGLNCLQAQSTRPKTVRPVFDASKQEQLRALIHTNPRTLGKSRSTWTLDLLAQVCWEQGITPKLVSGFTIHSTLKIMEIDWTRAKAWIVSPDPQYPLKKRQRNRLIELTQQHPSWAVGFLDEVWWSRLQQPQMHSWTEQTPLQLMARATDKTDPDPKAIACYGLWLKHQQQMLLRFVEQRPVSEITCAFLEWVCQHLEQDGKDVLALIWDNATWHLSQLVQQWIKTHNAQVKQSKKGIRLIVCQLPVKSPWLNAIEPKWVHGKRAIVEPERKLTAQELKTRICDYFDCPLLEPLAKKVP